MTRLWKLILLSCLIGSIMGNFGMTDLLSLVDRMRSPGNILDRLDAAEINIKALQGRDTQAQNLNEIAADTWDLNTSFPSICQGRLTLASGVPVTSTNQAGNTIYFAPYIGNLIGMYNKSSWYQIPFSELSISAKQSQNGNTHNGTAVIDGLTDTSQLVVNMVVSGTGIPSTAVIQSIDSATQITMNVNSTATATVSVTFQVPQNQMFDIFMVDTGAGVLALRMLLWNAPTSGTITAITNVSPRVVTSNGHPLVTGQKVTIRNVNGATDVNATWRVGATTANTFALLDFAGVNSPVGSAYTSGGTWMFADGNQTRASAISLQDGIYVLTSDPTWRYLGTARTLSSSAGNILADNTGQRFLYNYYNRKLRMLARDVGTLSTWNVTTINTWLPSQNDVTNVVEWVVGVLEDEIWVRAETDLTSVSSGQGRIGIVVLSWGISGAAAPINFRINANNNGSATITMMATELFTIGQGAISQAGYAWAGSQEFASSLTNATYRGSGEYTIRGTIWD